MSVTEERGYYGAITSGNPNECVRFRTKEDMSDFRADYLLLCRKYRRTYEESFGSLEEPT